MVFTPNHVPLSNNPGNSTYLSTIISLYLRSDSTFNMTIIEYVPEESQILDLINDSIRNLQESGIEPKYILVGASTYDMLTTAMSKRFKRERGNFETYQFFPIVLDPFRDNTVCVIPGPGDCKEGVRTYKAP